MAQPNNVPAKPPTAPSGAQRSPAALGIPSAAADQQRIRRRRAQTRTGDHARLSRRAAPPPHNRQHDPRATPRVTLGASGRASQEPGRSPTRWRGSCSICAAPPTKARSAAQARRVDGAGAVPVPLVLLPSTRPVIAPASLAVGLAGARTAACCSPCKRPPQGVHAARRPPEAAPDRAQPRTTPPPRPVCVSTSTSTCPRRKPARCSPLRWLTSRWSTGRPACSSGATAHPTLQSPTYAREP